MSTSVSNRSPASGQLADLATAINQAHAETLTAARTTLEHARHVGELLNEAKAAIDHGGWLSWLAASVTFSTPTAQRYMRVASRWDEISNTSSVTHLTEATALLADSKPATSVAPTTLAGDLTYVAFSGRGDFAEIIPCDQPGYSYVAVYRFARGRTETDGGGIVDYMKRGIRNDYVDRVLDELRFRPDEDGWRERPHDGELPYYIKLDMAEHAQGVWR